jgi:hypothetical protein
MTQLYGIMSTDGGPHPSDKWAEITANMIVDTILVDDKPDNVSDEARAARKAKRDLRGKLFDIFDGHHDRVQRHERGGCGKIKKADQAETHADHAQTPLDVTPHLGVMDEVAAVFAETPWAAHLAKPETMEVVKAIIGQHTANVMNIERCWHRDRLTAKGA